MSYGAHRLMDLGRDGVQDVGDLSQEAGVSWRRTEERDRAARSILQQAARRDAKCISNPPQRANGRVPGASLQVAQIASLEAGAKRHLLLGEAQFIAYPARVFPQEGDNVHRSSRVEGRGIRCPPDVS